MSLFNSAKNHTVSPICISSGTLQHYPACSAAVCLTAQNGTTRKSDLPSHHPPLDFNSAEYQTLCRSFELKRRLEGERLDAFEDTVSAAYLEGRARECKRFVAQSKMNSGRTQRELANEINVDRSVLSVVLNHGEIGSDPLANMICDPAVIQAIFGDGDLLLRRCGRAGMIRAAQTTATFCEIALEPSDFNDDMYEQLCRTVERTLGVPELASLPHLEAKWLEVLTYTFATVEGLGCESLWWEIK